MPVRDGADHLLPDEFHQQGGAFSAAGPCASTIPFAWYRPIPNPPLFVGENGLNRRRYRGRSVRSFSFDTSGQRVGRAAGNGRLVSFRVEIPHANSGRLDDDN
jgi:hypothetical protein